jgi:hypothetical protein
MLLEALPPDAVELAGDAVESAVLLELPLLPQADSASTDVTRSRPPETSLRGLEVSRPLLNAISRQVCEHSPPGRRAAARYSAVLR